ncbi:hypothetical protein AB0E59_32560 [Lentzea sp. NPDC034063]|uniref:hypothetical protein n=1 Tax=unclassified Lentzea TaxID=2643253 RepID=UPI0033F2D87F
MRRTELAVRSDVDRRGDPRGRGDDRSRRKVKSNWVFSAQVPNRSAAVLDWPSSSATTSASATGNGIGRWLATAAISSTFVNAVGIGSSGQSMVCPVSPSWRVEARGGDQAD